MSEKPHKKLIVWQKAMSLIERMYEVTEPFPRGEQFSLVAQMRRAAISIASNIAEGAARQTAKETTQFMFVARGSISELDTQIEIAHRLGFLNDKQCSGIQEALDEVSRLLQGLITHRRQTSLLTHSLTHSLTHPLTPQ